MQIDYLSKELIRSYEWSDFNEERRHHTNEIINGRTYIKTGRYCATSFVGEVFKIDSSSDEPFKYVMLIGMARQHPNEHNASRKAGIEIAAENAFTNPVMEFKMIALPHYEDFVKIVEAYFMTIPYQYVRTRAERELLDEDKYISFIY